MNRNACREAKLDERKLGELYKGIKEFNADKAKFKKDNYGEWKRLNACEYGLIWKNRAHAIAEAERAADSDYVDLVDMS